MSTGDTSDSAAPNNPPEASTPVSSQSGPNATPAPASGKKQNAVWRSCDDATLISVLKTQRELGNQADNGWKKVAWTAVAAALVGGSGGVKVWSGCRDHWRLLVHDYNMVHWLRTEVSGFSWDEVTHCAVATPQVWDGAIKERSKIVKFCGKSFPLYDEIADLVEGRQANGKAAYHVGHVKKRGKKTTSYSDDPLAETQADNAPKSPQFDFTYSHSASPVSTQPSSAAAVPSVQSPPHTPQRGQAQHAPHSPAESESDGQKHRCLRSLSSSPIRSASAKKSRITGPVAVNNVAGAMAQVATSISAAATEIATPTRRQKAIRMIASDKEVSSDIKLKAINLFTQNIAMCDTYLAIDDHSLRNQFLTGVLNITESM